jgi:hypothetical protein
MCEQGMEGSNATASDKRGKVNTCIADNQGSADGDAKTSKQAEAIRAFMHVTEAYKILTDSKKKRVYEVSGSTGLKRLESGPRFEDPLRDAYK